jgi:predicted Zn-dependent peptidase
MMGQPILGDRDNITNNTISHETVSSFHKENYFGENMIVVGTGDVNHEQLISLVQQHFGKLTMKPDIERKGMNKPVYIPAMMLSRDDELRNACVGIFYDAPSWNHEDYYAFLLLERLFGTYMNEQRDQIKNYNKQYILLTKIVDSSEITL